MKLTGKITWLGEERQGNCSKNNRTPIRFVWVEITETEVKEQSMIILVRGELRRDKIEKSIANQRAVSINTDFNVFDFEGRLRNGLVADILDKRLQK